MELTAKQRSDALQNCNPDLSPSLPRTPPAKGHLANTEAKNMQDDPTTDAPTTRLVGLRVDALVMAYQLAPDPDALAVLDAAIAEAAEQGATVLEFAGSDRAFELKRCRQPERAVFSNLDVRCQWDPNASGGWQLEVVPCATYLATHSLDEALAECRHVASCFGDVEVARVRRVDLAGDYEHFPLATMGADALLTSRSRTCGFQTQAKDIGEVERDGERWCAVRAYRASDSTITGYSISPGNVLMARLYDKTVELQHPGREGKRVLEHEIWTRNGWQGDSVTRVEFQLRGTALDEMKLRRENDVRTKLDKVWQYCTRKWLRCIDPASATRRKRCKTLPAWDAVQTTLFAHPDEPVTRLRVRRGATPEHALGTVLSLLGAKGQLKRLYAGSADGFVSDKGTQTVEWYQERVRETFRQAAELTISHMVGKHGIRDAAMRYCLKHEAVSARFFTSDAPEDHFAADLERYQPFDPLVACFGRPSKVGGGEVWLMTA